MYSYYVRLPEWFMAGDNIQIRFLILAALVQAFLFLTLYTQSSSHFPGLKGGMIFGLGIALLVFLPLSLYQMAVVEVNDLRPILGQWLNLGFISNLILGAVCGTFYKR